MRFMIYIISSPIIGNLSFYFILFFYYYTSRQKDKFNIDNEL